MRSRAGTVALLATLLVVAAVLAGCSARPGPVTPSTGPGSPAPPATTSAGEGVGPGQGPSSPPPGEGGEGSGSQPGGEGTGEGGDEGHVGGDVPAEPAPEAAPTHFTCRDGVVEERFATHGHDGKEPGDGGLQWAALKTGFRFVAAWTTAAPTTATLTYSIDGGPWTDAAEPWARTAHLFILNGLPEGKVLCFRAVADGKAGPLHAVRLANAMRLAEEGVYTINLLVLANEQPRRSILERGMDYYADLLWDATDGHVRAGEVIVVYADLQRIHGGFVACGFVRVGGDPGCDRAADVIFTHEHAPFAAGVTTLDGIESPSEQIWMNQLFEAGQVLGSSDQEVGSVLTHELGHYAFGMGDMYTNLGAGADCYDEGLGISVMGSNRDATEYDDAAHPCPNASLLSGYEPSWTSLIARFKLIPQRIAAPLPGPEGHGGAYHLGVFDMTPV